MTDTAIDMAGLQRLLAERPEELRALLNDVDNTMLDCHGRAIHKFDKVVTTRGEAGKAIRLDYNTKRVLVELPNGQTRLLMAHRVEVRRGRPRKDSLKVAG